MDDTTPDPKKLLSEIEAFLVSTGMNPSDFGTLSKNDSGLVFRLREGKDVRSGTASHLRRFMKTHRRPLAEPTRKTLRSSAHA